MRRWKRCWGWQRGKSAGVWPQLAELVYNHEGYGRFSVEAYESWIDLTVTVVVEVAGVAWNTETEAAWWRQAERKNVLLTEAGVG
jgi:hypothetical protein